jgi:hypothetical protein
MKGLNRAKPAFLAFRAQLFPAITAPYLWPFHNSQELGLFHGDRVSKPHSAAGRYAHVAVIGAGGLGTPSPRSRRAVVPGLAWARTRCRAEHRRDP